MNDRTPAPVERLPTQHPQHPHCPSCGADLPSFKGATFSVSDAELKGTKLLSIAFRIECRCGAQWDLHKAVR